jgi:hypothetical protein
MIRMAMTRTAALLLGAFILGVGCSSAPAVHADRLKERPLRGSAVLLIDPDVRLFEKTSSGEYDFRVDWTRAAERVVMHELVDQLNNRRMDLVAYEMPPPGSGRDHDLQIVRLHSAVSEAILAHHLSSDRRLPSKQGKLDWTLGPGVAQLKGVRKANYVLLVCLRDSYSAASRGLAGVFGSEMKPMPGEQWGFVSLVEKETGDIVWCNRLPKGVGDLREEEPARQAVKALLERFPL